ncbi:hypothetical protein [Bacillus piscicola]|uniref:hypothetical protein n=1 Tax=Bacillus piscicola TaxID=1632684 RepID=UPI001F089F3A|nr:hypothetical protein [Bacillus piscicola]
MNKKGLIILFSMILVLTGGLVAAGQIITSQEKARPAFTGEYDLGKEDQLLYVTAQNGVQSLFVQSEDGVSQLVYESEEGREILSPVFSGEEEVTFISTTGAPEEPPGEQEFQLVYSDVMTVNTETGKKTNVLHARGFMEEILYDATHDRMIVNGVHLSTSTEPEAGFIPFESDLYTLKRDGNWEKIRSFEAYAPGSLRLVDDGKKLLMILPDDFAKSTPESMFQATERIYEMEIDDPAALDLVSKKKSDIPISEFVLFEDETTLLYQTIMNWGEGGKFLYDLVWFDRAEKEEGDRLHINEAVMNSKLNEHETFLYYVKMSQKANQTNQYNLFRFALNGEKGEEEIKIE